MVTATAAVVVIPTTNSSRGFFFLFFSPALRLVRLLFLLSLSNIACPGRTATVAADASSSSSSSSASSYLNVYGNPLQPCSTNGTALTGYTRNGYCVERNDDSGSHHICLNLNTTTLTTTTDDDDDNYNYNYNYNNKNNIYYQNFCDVTGQDDDWCSAQDMPCHDNPEDESCAIEYWCVCQWAFASYLEKIGGCNAIQKQQQQQQDDDDIIIQCNAINIEAVRAYKSTRGFDTALACLVEQCGLHPNSSIYNMPAVNKNEQAWRRFASLSLVVAVTATLATFVYKNRHHHHQKWRSCCHNNSLHQEVLLVSNNVGNVGNNNNHKVALLSSEEEDYSSSIQHHDHHHDQHHHHDHHGDPKSTGSNHVGGSGQARRHSQKIAPI